MTKYSTKRALVASVLALAVCVSMLIGTTFAWFTDNATTGSNVIKSGKLDVVLEMKDNAGEWVSAEGATLNWVKAAGAPANEEVLWEPGCTYVLPELRIRNAGNLALKYQVQITGFEGDKELLDVIEFTGIPVQDVTESLLPGAAETFVIKGHMDENAGNEYQDLTLTGVAITVFATQYTYEYDSEDNQYDAGAYLPVVYTLPELEAALNEGGSVKLGGSITDTNIEPYSSTRNVVLLYRPTQDATFEGGKVVLDNTTANWGFVVDAKNDVNVTVKDTEIVGNNNWNMHNIVAPGSTLTIDNVKVSASGGNGIYVMGGGEAIISDATVAQDGMNPNAAPWAPTAVALSGNSTVKINSGIYEGTTYGAYIYNSGGNLVINGGNFKAPVVLKADGGYSNTAPAGTIVVNGGNFDGKIERNNGRAYITINGGNFTNFAVSNQTWCIGNISIKGGTFDNDPSAYVADGYIAVDKGNGTFAVEREYINVNANAGATAAENGTVLADAINATTENSFLSLPEGEYKMPSVTGDKEVTIVGTKDTVIDVTLGAYLDGSAVSFEGVTIKGSRGKVNGNGADDAALYTPNVTYTNCTFEGPFAVGRDGAKFINCTFNNLGNDYVWNMACDTVFDGCTFNTEGKALLLYAHGSNAGDEMTTVVVKNCTFNATKSAKAGAIANQPCAAIEIHNYGCGFNLTTENNTYDSDFSGEWRIKTYENRNALYTITVNGTEYTSIALDGKDMTIDAANNVTVIG